MIPISPNCTQSTLLYIWATPRASYNRLGEIAIDSNQQSFLRVYVTDSPENGAANKSIIKLLSKTLKISKSSFVLIRGHTDRKKTFKVHLDVDTLSSSLKLATGALF